MEALFVLLVLSLLSGPVLGVIALVKSSTLERKLRTLKDELEGLATRGEPAVTASVPAAKPVASAAASAATPTAEKVAEEKPLVVDKIKPATGNEAPTHPKSSAPVRNVEQALASRWLVWLGGGAIGLGGLLLVKYAHDQGLVPPLVRVVIGWVFGGALIAGAEWLRVKRGKSVEDYVPAALSAAGLIVAFGVTYAAYALYNIVAPAVCFPILAAISLFAMWLSLRQGPLIAALGLLGATVAPALVSTSNPSTSGFFAYLLVILVAALWLLRRVNWWWLGFAAVAVSVVWSMLWIADKGTTPHLPIGLFGLMIGVATALVPRGKAILAESMGSLWDTKTLSPPMGLAIAGCVGGGLVLAALVVQSGHANVPLVLFAIGMAAIVAFGWFRNGLVSAPLLAAAASLFVLLAWREVGFHEWAFDERGFWTTVPGLIEPARFRTVMLLAMVGYAAVGVFGVVRKAQHLPWAILAAASAFLFLFAAWGRADHSLSTAAWVGMALAAIAGLGFAIRSLMPQQAAASRSIETLVVGCAVLALFALDRLLDGVWLTIAIAGLATGLAWLTRLIDLPRIGGIASVVAGFAAARLFVGREFWGEPQGLLLGQHWPLYGYGAPAALFWYASRILKRDGFEKWRVAFEGVSLGLLISLISLELRVLIGGSISHDGVSMLEWAAHGCTWLGAAFGLAYRQQLYSSLVSNWGARILAGGATLAFLCVLTVRNPVLSGDFLQGGQYFNALWLAYLLPVPLYALFARKLEGLGLGQLRSGVGIFALVLLLTFVTLIVKRQFQGPFLDLGFATQGESYSISLAWLLTGIGIFIAGLKMDRQTVRYGGLAVLVLTVVKVFGYDLFQLGGLWRIASIIGLGACLIGVGWLYTQYVGKPSGAIGIETAK